MVTLTEGPVLSMVNHLGECRRPEVRVAVRVMSSIAAVVMAYYSRGGVALKEPQKIGKEGTRCQYLVNFNGIPGHTR